ncbi:MAG: 1-(5-phosphoribosyl)-5-[(5-phosphoribosylamino)methylideneamino] imidazole-4-carboxamide isomerase [Firmicutes bacterium]|nr:1-(5-phosphoribosyl)-5-[(5-phosphoribosylamino)methylideneamino] imidazole-4-carboxamide isomerase [Alicyclobacillaceae bacterium]MCL6496184.1 1-(5-phosphoribosyl)-5-[(5-phosphoribosylamino)methylideneamino] imidazole-4-carboxamide isomerase [Bacillota bacterium]
MFTVVPSIPVAFGRVVPEAEAERNPLRLAWRWMASGARRIHLEDRGGRRGNAPSTLPALVLGCQAGPALIQVGGGIWEPREARALVGAGAARLVVHAAWFHPRRLGRLADAVGAERLVLGVRLPLPEGAGALLKAARALGVAEAVLSGPAWNPESVRDAVAPWVDQGFVVWAAGHIETLEAVEALKAVGARGAIVGRALYLRRLDWQALRGLEVPRPVPTPPGQRVPCAGARPWAAQEAKDA